jgi:hypothetical protein
MTQEALRMALEVLEKNTKHLPADFDYHFEAITAIKEALAQPERHELQAKGEHPAPCARHCEATAFGIVIKNLKAQLAQTQEPVAVYGYCPECGAKGVMRERRPNGNDKCANGHTYPSSISTPPQRTWVGLTADEIWDEWLEQSKPERNTHNFVVAFTRAIEAKLKELNA